MPRVDVPQLMIFDALSTSPLSAPTSPAFMSGKLRSHGLRSHLRRGQSLLKHGIDAFISKLELALTKVQSGRLRLPRFKKRRTLCRRRTKSRCK